MYRIEVGMIVKRRWLNSHILINADGQHLIYSHLDPRNRPGGPTA